MFGIQLPGVSGPLRWVTGLIASVIRPPANPLTVMVVGEHSVFTEALAIAIDATGTSACVAVVAGAEQAHRAAARLSPDVAVIDLDPGTDDFTTIRALVETRPALRIMVLTDQGPNAELIRGAVEAGASAVFPKATSLGIVVSALPTLSEYLFTTDKRTIVALFDRPPTRAPAPSQNGQLRPSQPNPLTRRERDILTLLDSGVDLPSASDRLGISVNTTRGYVKNLYRKLDVHSQVELLAVARDLGLLEGDAN